MENRMDNKVKKKGTLWLIAVVISIISVAVFSPQISLGGVMKDSNPQINNMYIPLEATLEEFGFNIIDMNKNFIKFVKGTKEINFVNEENYNLKKDNNTYYSKVSNGIYFIKIGVLKDLGYKVDDDFFVGNKKDKLRLDIESFIEILHNNYIHSEESNLDSSTSYYNHRILKQYINTEELTDYTIENNNIMGYNLNELEDYIKANYKMTLKQYKKNLISIDTKYPSYLRLTYDLLDNGQIIATIVDSSRITHIELAIEIKDKVVFVEK